MVITFTGDGNHVVADDVPDTCGGGSAACGANCTCGPNCTCGDGKPSGECANDTCGLVSSSLTTPLHRWHW
ncbi:hypothetical protein HF086_010911 [Spodoptera exigua]|uniref:Uncharacterized protein n=1 Tax=Spodoptera exigua TaxID=7107 RepID=A0A922MJC8_SPOEX|nr:hypothetical protein HF086_010911 [Spodoptera exigua]